MTKNEIIGRLREAGISASSTDRSAAAYVEDAVGIRATAGWFGFRIACDSADTERRVRTVLERYYNVEISGGVWRLQSKRRLSVMAFGGGMPPTPPTPPTPTADYLCFTANKAGATLRMVGQYTEGHEDEFALEYSTDGETWNEYEFTNDNGDSVGLTLTFSNIGDKVYFRGDNPKGTSDIDMLLQQDGYYFIFMGGDETDWRDNEFSLSGDLQTIVDKTGQNKTAGCFIMLFGRSASDEGEYISVTTPPSCSATSLSFYCFYRLFGSQTSLLTPMDISNIDVDIDNADSFVAMYDRCTFNITSDNGVTLNGFGDIEYPITINAGSEITVNNNFDFAYILLGNFNGFDNAKLTIIAEGSGSIDANAYSNSGGGGGSRNYYYWIPTNSSATAIMTATPDEGYQFVKWQTSSDGETWTDIPDATSTTLNVTLTQAGDYYYKAIFEQTNP